MNQPGQPPVLPQPPQAHPIRLQRYEPDAPAGGRGTSKSRTWLHPVSALVILGIDWLLFAEEVITFELALPLTCVLGFVSTTIAVYWIQRRKQGDARGTALLKALFGGFIAGLPTSVGGTVLGTVVLMMAGLRGRAKTPPSA